MDKNSDSIDRIFDIIEKVNKAKFDFEKMGPSGPPPASRLVRSDDAKEDNEEEEDQFPFY